MDFDLTCHGTIWLLTPVSHAAQQWAADHLDADTPMLGASFAIEHRFIDPIVDGIRRDGLRV